MTNQGPVSKMASLAGRLPAGVRPGALAVLISFGCCRGSLAAPMPPPPAPADDWNPAAETVVIFNRSFPGSRVLAEFYAKKRDIPGDRLVGLECPGGETITRAEFETTVRETLLRKFAEMKWWAFEKRDLVDPGGKPVGQGMEVVRQDIRVAVLMRGVPLRIKRSVEMPDVPAAEADEASVDSEIAALGLAGRPIKGPLQNRYFQSLRRFADHHESRGQVLVGRLDAADDDTVRRMIEDSLRAEREGLWGRAVVDFALKDGVYLEGERWLGGCVKACRDSGIPVFVDRNKEVLRDGWPLPDTILYFGWYAEKVAGALASPDFRFQPGAIACHLHSLSAATLRTRTDGWCGPLLHHGAAAVLGNVWEPYLTLTTRIDLMTARLLDGLTLGEAAWGATPALSWMNVVAGDPLYTPFPKGRELLAKDGRGGEYAAYRDIARRLMLQDGKKFRRELVRVAEAGRAARILEMAGLYSTMENVFGEAEDFFLHARALYPGAADQLRCALYAAELAQRKGNLEESRGLLRGIASDPRFSRLPGLGAALAMEKETLARK